MIRILLGILLVFSFTSFSQEIAHEHNSHYSFIENKGQWNENVLFKSIFTGGNMWVQQRKFIFHFQDFSVLKQIHANPRDNGPVPVVNQSVLHLNFLGSNTVQNIEQKGKTSHYFNYFVGNDPQKWASDVHGYSEAILHELYNGIDLKLLEEKSHLKYEFIVRPGSNPQQIKLSFSGHQSIEITSSGDLKVLTSTGLLTEKAPYCYQIKNGKIVTIPSMFKLSGEEVTFEIGNYDPSVTLVIDPVLVFASYSGSVTDNFGMTATYAYDGSAYSAGTVFGNAYPMPDSGAYDVNSNFTLATNGVYGITDVFISKYASDGSTMLWATYLGGGNSTEGTETAQSMICDKQNNLYLYGSTSSTDFPIVGGLQSTHAGGTPNSNYYYNGVYFSNQGTDMYIAKLSSNGHSLLASTYLGGSSNDGVNFKTSSGTYNSVASYDSLTSNYGDQFRGEIMLDEIGNCWVASCTHSSDFPTMNPVQATNRGLQDGVLVKLNSSLSSLLFSTYYGGSNNDACYSIKIDSSQNIVFGGGTSSSDLIGINGWQSNYNGGKADGFIVKLPSSAAIISAATYIGTVNYDQTFFIEIDRNDNVFAVGQSQGGGFPVVNAGYVNPGSGQYILKLNPSLNSVLNSTVFGNSTGQVNISPAAFLVDICGNVYVSGWGANILQGIALSGMPVTGNAFQSNPPNGYDFYLIVINNAFDNLLYASYLGGAQAQEHVDGGTSRFDKNGVVYQSVCGGCGGHSDFPTTAGAWSNQNLSSNCNNILFKFDFQLIPKASFLADQTTGCASFTVTLDNNSSQSDSFLWDFGNGDTTSQVFNPVLTYSDPGVYNIKLFVTDSICLLTDSALIKITVFDSLQVSVTNDIFQCEADTITLWANSNGTASSFLWSSNSAFSDTLNSNPMDSLVTLLPSGSAVYYVKVSNGGCSEVDSVIVDFTTSNFFLSGQDSLCLGDPTTINANGNSPFTISYDWSPDAILVSPDGNASIDVLPTMDQFVYLTASTSNGCVIEDSIFINLSTIGNGVVVASASDYLIPAGTSVQLFGYPDSLIYSWSSVNVVLPNPNDQSPTITLTEDALFTLSAGDGICLREDTVFVKVYGFVCGPPYLFVPNAFSPNGDNENDVLFVRGEVLTEMVFRVFTRWGELVFETKERSNGWDGTFKGRLLDPDVYDYYLQGVCIGGQEYLLKGNVTLMR